MSIKVLMIDDDPAMTELIALLLRSHGLDVLACNDSTQSVEMVRRENPDVILLDLMMPGQDGWEVCKAIRAFSRVPIAILSAIDDPAVIASALDLRRGRLPGEAHFPGRGAGGAHQQPGAAASGRAAEHAHPARIWPAGQPAVFAGGQTFADVGTQSKIAPTDSFVSGGRCANLLAL